MRSTFLHRAGIDVRTGSSLGRAIGAVLAMFAACLGTAAAGAPAPTFPVTIQHQWGSTTIPSRPLRVVALGWSEADVVLALGVTPVAIQDWQQLGLTTGKVNPWAQSLVHDPAPVILPRGDLDLRQIAALHPDLILDVNGRDNSSKTNYALLSMIAPTVASPRDLQNNNLPWQRQVSIDALALGKVDVGEKLIADTTARINAVKAAHPEFAGKTFTINWGVQNGWHSYVQDDVRPQFLEKIGLSLSPKVANLHARNYFADLPIERTGVIDADVVLLVAFARPASSIVAEPAVRALPAFQHHRIVLLDNLHDAELRAAFATGSPTSIAYSLDHLVPRIERALAGAGAGD
jgi:iron complex transport system substrate-binding protein